MADDRYGGYGRGEEWRRRDESIFTDDDDRWGRGPGRATGDRGRARDEERGFFERAGDEVRSWFGDEEAERRRERDMRRDEAREAFSGGYRDQDERYGSGRFGGGRGDWGRDPEGLERRDPGGRGGFSGRSGWDPNYRRWRDQQIEQFDREYEEYCRERQRQFDQDFDSWRSSRLTEGAAPDRGSRTGAARSRGAETAAATTAAAGTASSGASGGSGESAGTVAAGGEPGSAGGRGRARSRG